MPRNTIRATDIFAVVRPERNISELDSATESAERTIKEQFYQYFFLQNPLFNEYEISLSLWGRDGRGGMYISTSGYRRDAKTMNVVVQGKSG